MTTEPNDDDTMNCTECGGPVAYGSRHTYCGAVAMKYQNEIDRLTAERDRALDRIAEMSAELKGSVGARWINPNDKTQEQYLPWIGAPCLFAHEGVTYYGHHTGGSFQTGRGVAARFFPTWRSLWMPLPAAPKPEDAA